MEEEPKAREENVETVTPLLKRFGFMALPVLGKKLLGDQVIFGRPPTKAPSKTPQQATAGLLANNTNRQ